MEKNIIEDIIERLEKEHGKNGIYALCREWYKNNFTIDLYEMNGFIWGLEATGFITKEEADEARKFLRNK